MNEIYRKRLFEALLGDVDYIPVGHPAREALERNAADTLNDIEPIIDEMLKGGMSDAE